MSLLFVSCSQLLYCSNPPDNFPTNKKSSISSCTLKLSPVSRRLSGRYRFRAKSGDRERDTVELGSQISRENVAVPTNGSNPSTSFLSVLCPLLKLFSGGDPSGERIDFSEVATSSMSSLARLPWGSRSLSNSGHSQEITTIDPPVCLQLFEFEACPFCRRVREAMTELDLSVEVYPCPKGSVRHREMVRKFGGKEQFPFLVDPNTGVSIYESSKR